MHNNFYYLRQLTKSLETRLKGAIISECFSQNKDELILRFEIGVESFRIRASLLPGFSCLSFPETFQRARKNSVDLFSDAIGRRLLSIRQFNNERSFALVLSEDRQLLFKMHGNRTNIILFHEEGVPELFRKNLSADVYIKPESLDRDIDWSHDHFKVHANDPRPIYFTFGKVVWRYLDEHGFSSKNEDEQWLEIQSVVKILEDPAYYITLIGEKPTLSLLKTGEVQKTLHQPIDAANEFFYSFTQLYAFSREKARLLNALKARSQAGRHYCAKNTIRLQEIKSDDHYRLWADLIMANLHQIKPGSDKALLQSFDETQSTVEIKLKKDITPQRNAEIFYKKAKNQHIEIERLESSIRQKEEEMKGIEEEIQVVEAAADLKSLRNLKLAIRTEQDKQDAGSTPFHEFRLRDFRILVGKNAQNNDLLTFKHSYKEDLWLHAKDVSGSHVLIKYQAGKQFPKDVIEYAASLAAFNSKRKTDTLCPVIVTPKKYVRKRKGDPAGAVVVEREKILMVEPLKIS